MNLKISVRDVGNVSILDLAGRLTLGEPAGALRDTMKDLLARNRKNLLVNLGEVSYIDSSGLGDLVGGFATVSNRGGSLKLLNVQNRVHELMQITKLYSVFEVFDNEVDAVRSFEGAATA